MIRQKIPTALSGAALLIAVFGSTPIGEAATRVLFAKNADKVDGIHASRIGTPGKLLALNKYGKFPASVVPPGATGPQGPAGPAGPQGLPGAQGEQGEAGTDGLAGAVGPEGLPGATGADGRTGAEGQQGPEGPPGPQGPQGQQGPEGPQGPQGQQGPDGPQGQQGPDGPQGPEGPRGPEGPEGPTGPRGPSDGYSRFVEGPVAVPDASGSVAELNLTAGMYVIVGKGWFQNAGIGAVTMTCSLRAGDSADRTDFNLPASGVASASFVLVHTFVVNGSATLSCADGGGVANVSARDIRITAIKVANLTVS